MSRKTLALIAGLTVLCLVLVVLALNMGPKAPEAPATGEETEVSEIEPSPTVPAHTTVNLQPNPVIFSSSSASVDVMIDTDDNEVTGAQFEIVYDPEVLNVSTIRQGTFFENALILINRIEREEGRITYALGLTPTGMQNPSTGTGTVATVVFTRRSTAPRTGTTELKMENVMIAAKDIGPSVLKQATGTIVNLSSTASSPSAQ